MSSSPRFPTELADRCVKCGLCLPHCPTYGLAGVEGESPRGRIALMQALASGRLEPAQGLTQHLEQCLGCRACERVCPADVPYGELIDAGRELLAARGVRPGLPRRGLAGVLHRPWLMRLGVVLARQPALRALARRLGGWPARAVELLPADSRPPRRPRTAGAVHGVNSRSTEREALLFTGCVGGAVDGQALDDVCRVLGAAGWRVRVPRGQGCCGALDQHAGRRSMARRLAERNLEALGGDATVVACASGCAATLGEYGLLAGEAGARFAARVRDPAELLADSDLELVAARHRRVALHVPCTQRNVTRSDGATRRLLDRIRGLQWTELPAGCCGAAGEHFIAQPAHADALLEPWLQALASDPPDALVTSNVGCALHFRAGLARAGLDVAVLHPASLVAGALR
jgi:glycolate oxidase iron-sulfur subunit